MQDFHRVIGRALLDENFRAQLFNQPDAALQGFDLSPQEIQTLQNLSPEQFNVLARQFGQQLPGGDGLAKATVDYFNKAGDPAAAQADYFQKAQYDWIKGESSFAKHLPASEQGGPSPHMRPGGAMKFLNQSLGLVVIAIIAILIGLLLFFGFAPTKTINGGFQALSLNFTCGPDPASSELPGGGVQVAVGDVNRDSTAEARKAGEKQQEYLVVKFNDLLISSYQTGGSGHLLDLAGVLVGLNDMRLAMGGESFLPPCGELPADPDEGGETGGGTGSATGGQPPDNSIPPNEGSSPPDGGLCANNGGIQWQGSACVCPGVMDNVTICNDGTKIDQVTDQACTPDQACQQPPDPANPPSACPCTYVCVDQAVAAAGQCYKYEWRDCTGVVCTPQQVP